MTITLDSKSFRDTAKKLDDLAAENQLTKDMYKQILEEEGFDEEEFKKTYNEYVETPEEELIQPTEVTGLPVVDPLIRMTGRAFGEAGRETVDFFEDVAPVTTPASTLGVPVNPDPMPVKLPAKLVAVTIPRFN